MSLPQLVFLSRQACWKYLRIRCAVITHWERKNRGYGFLQLVTSHHSDVLENKLHWTKNWNIVTSFWHFFLPIFVHFFSVFLSLSDIVALEIWHRFIEFFTVFVCQIRYTLRHVCFFGEVLNFRGTCFLSGLIAFVTLVDRPKMQQWNDRVGFNIWSYCCRQRIFSQLNTVLTDECMMGPCKI